MKNLFFFLASSLANSVSAINTQSKGFQSKHSDAVYHTFFTSGGDKLQTFESADDGITFGMIKIHLKEPYFYLTDAEKVLHNFLNLLQYGFDIVHATDADYMVCKKEKQHITTVYWQDATQTDWKVCGWTNGQRMTVQYIKNINGLPVEWEDYFFKSLEAA